MGHFLVFWDVIVKAFGQCRRSHLESDVVASEKWYFAEDINSGLSDGPFRVFLVPGIHFLWARLQQKP